MRFFLPFWASINDLTRTPSFHLTVSSSMPSSCPQPMAVVVLLLLFQIAWTWFHYGYERRNDDDRGNWLGNFSSDYVYYSWEEWKNEGLPEPVERIAKTSWPRTRFKQILILIQANALHLKTPHTGNARLQLFIVASMYAWFNNRCLSPSRLHSSSMSPVLEC